MWMLCGGFRVFFAASKNGKAAFNLPEQIVGMLCNSTKLIGLRWDRNGPIVRLCGVVWLDLYLWMPASNSISFCNKRVFALLFSFLIRLLIGFEFGPGCAER